MASGGLSHDIGNYRAGWIDEPLDRWVLDHLARRKGRDLQGMFDLESDALRGGAAHVRMWTAVAGACESLGARAEILDYIPACMAATGLGFATWAIPGSE
jgi:protocatechuate 4,5-dioxygenase beta chain